MPIEFVGAATGFGSNAAHTVSLTTATAASQAGIVATLAAVEAPDAASLTASVGVAAVLSVSQAPNVVVLTGAVAISAMLDAIEASDTFAGTIGAPSAGVRFAYPGDVRAGVMATPSRAGALLNATRTGTLSRG